MSSGVGMKFKFARRKLVSATRLPSCYVTWTGNNYGVTDEQGESDLVCVSVICSNKSELSATISDVSLSLSPNM